MQLVECCIHRECRFVLTGGQGTPVHMSRVFCPFGETNASNQHSPRQLGPVSKCTSFYLDKASNVKQQERLAPLGLR